MIQKARSSDSNSLLRELEFMSLLIQNEKDRNYLLKKLNEIYKKRNEPMGASGVRTGIKDFKELLLAYLNAKGEVETANIWARALPYDEKSIKDLILIIQNQLMKQKIEGILEIHLQDREINSPHIQFVGNNAPKAEQIIATILVKLKYEIDMENALGKKHFTPYYEINTEAKYPKYDDLKNAIAHYKTLTSAEANIESIKADLDRFDNVANSLRKQLKEFVEIKRENKAIKRLQELMAKTQTAFIDTQNYNRLKQQNENKLKHLDKKRAEYRMKRLRRRRR